MKDKLIKLLKTNEESAVQAIELNKTLGLLKDREIEVILNDNLKEYGWVVSEIIRKFRNLDADWDAFLQRLDGYGDTFEWGDDEYRLEVFPIVNIYGNIQVSLKTNEESLAEYGQKIGNPFVLAEKQVLSWLSKQPLVEKVLGKPRVLAVNHIQGDTILAFSVEIELPSIYKILSEH